MPYDGPTEIRGPFSRVFGFLSFQDGTDAGYWYERDEWTFCRADGVMTSVKGVLPPNTIAEATRLAAAQHKAARHPQQVDRGTCFVETRSPQQVAAETAARRPPSMRRMR